MFDLRWPLGRCRQVTQLFQCWCWFSCEEDRSWHSCGGWGYANVWRLIGMFDLRRQGIYPLGWCEAGHTAWTALVLINLWQRSEGGIFVEGDFMWTKSDLSSPIAGFFRLWCSCYGGQIFYRWKCFDVRQLAGWGRDYDKFWLISRSKL